MDSVWSDDISTSESDLYKSAGDLYRSLQAAGRRSFETRIEKTNSLESLLCLQRLHWNTLGLVEKGEKICEDQYYKMDFEVIQEQTIVSPCNK